MANITLKDLKDARDPLTAVTRLTELASHPKRLIIYDLLRNPGTPPEALAIIAERHPEEKFWRDIAKHPGISPELLTKLSTCSYPRVLCLVAANPKTPSALLIAFSLQGVDLQQAVAKNPATPTDVLTKLSFSDNNGVLYALAQNPNTPPDVAMRCGTKFPSALLRNPALDLMLLEGPEMINDMSAEQIRALLYTKAPPEWVWKAAVQHQDIWLRAQAAKHKSIPEWALDELRKDTEPKVQKALAARSSTLGE